MKNLFSIILFAVLISACAKKNEVTIIAEFQKPKTHLTPQIKKEINERLMIAGFKQTHLESLPKNRFKIKFIVDRFDNARLAQAKSIFNIAELEFWDTYRLGESPVEGIVELVGEVPDFTPNTGESLPKQVLGLLDDTRVADGIFSEIKDLLSSKENLKLYLSEKHVPNLVGRQKYQIYLIDTKGKSEAALTSKHITNAKVESTPSGQVVSFNFDEEGAKIWAEMTTKAAENRNQAVALILNGSVVSAPIVQMPILTGGCQISGDFSNEEATLLANTFNLGSFSEQVEIIEISEEEVK